MGSELLTESLPNHKRKSLTEVFWEAYPAYLAMGMSSDEYWNGDAQACVAYRKAYEEKLELQDSMLWRQGLYIYHAMCAVAPYFNSIKPRKPEDYLASPFGIKEKKKPQENGMKAGLAYMKAWANRVNAMREINNGRQRTEH